MEKDTWVYKDKPKFGCFDFKDKDAMVAFLVMSMLQRTNSMFEYKGLPDTIPTMIFEELCQENGYVGIIEKDGKYFAVRGGVGGIRNYNYLPTKFIVSNPYLMTTSEAYEIYYGEDANVKTPLKDDLTTVGKCVIIPNDNYYMGLIPLCKYYATQLVENVISKRMVTIMSRAMYVFAAADEDVKEDFKDFINDITNGEFSSILAEGQYGSDIQKLITTLPLADDGHKALTDLIEDQQYIKASWYNDLGLQANYNMKRESINSNESQLNKDAVLPFVDTMLRLRKEGLERCNKLFGTNWSVELSSAWGYTRSTIEQAIDAIDPATQVANKSLENGVVEEKDDNQLNEGADDNEQV